MNTATGTPFVELVRVIRSGTHAPWSRPRLACWWTGSLAGIIAATRYNALTLYTLTIDSAYIDYV